MSERKDYYAILKIEKTATREEVKKSYHKLALKYHPDRNVGQDPETHQIAEQMFKEIAEAFEVLGNDEERSKYDRGAPPKFTPRPPRDIFEAFFGTQNPFGEIYNSMFAAKGAQPGTKPNPIPDPYGFNGSAYKPSIPKSGYPPNASPGYTPNQKAPAVTSDLPCTLEDLFLGAEKKIKISRKTYDKKGFMTPLEKILDVKLMPGWKGGTKITFAGEGDEVVGSQPGDLVFVVVEKPHPVFTRNLNDLVVNKKVTLLEALTGATVSCTLLDGKKFELEIKEVIKPGQKQVVPKEGFVSSRDASRGDLIFVFEVTFPLYLTPNDKDTLKKGPLSLCSYNY